MLRTAMTRSEKVFARLREDILGGRLEPGSRLRFAEICVHYDTSVGVVREALSRLAEQGLVTSVPQLGFRVASVSADDLVELTTARCDIEGLTLRYSVNHGDLEWESQVVASHHALERTPARIGDPPGQFNDKWPPIHKQFHLALLAGCPNTRLLNIALSLRDAAEMYRLTADRPVGHAAHRDTAAEHRAIRDAAVARDGDAAVAALVVHIQKTTQILLDNGRSIFPQDSDAEATVDAGTLTPANAKRPRSA